MENEPDMALENEDFSATPEESPREPDRLVEQERGLVLKINFPESTLATMLPIVNVIETARVLKKEFFSTRLETRLRDPVSVLKNEFLSAKVETNPSAPERTLPIPLLTELARVSELLRL